MCSLMNSLLKGSLIFLLLLCVQPLTAQQLLQNVDQNLTDNNWFNIRLEYDSTAFSGENYALVKATDEFGPGISQQFSAKTPFPGLQFFLEAALRMDQPQKKAFFVLSFIDSIGKQHYWHAFDLRPVDTIAEQWYTVSDSVAIPADVLRQTQLKAYFWNPEGAVLSIDNLDFRKKEMEQPNYLPEALKGSIPLGEPKVLYQNSYYELLYFSKNKAVALADKRGNLLTNGWFTQNQLQVKNEPFTKQSTQWKLRRIRQKDGKTYIRLINKSDWNRMVMDITASWEDPLIQYELKSRFKKRAQLEQQSLVIEFTTPLKKVYRKNRMTDSSAFQNQYYLRNQGFQFGKYNQSITLYHPSKLSSVQLDSRGRKTYLNLDAHFDHPMIHYPLLPDTHDVWRDKSSLQVKRGSEIHGRFGLLVGEEPHFLPRIMPVPSGFEAALAWSEHADWTNIRTHRAVNFGHEKITHADSATGGFVFYDIPVTKSVFYNNPDGVTNTAISDSLFIERHASIIENRAFAYLLKQLFEQGHEICLHTPEQFTSTRKNLKESLGYMQQHFGSAVWIDHGYNNSANNNRENWVCDGQLKRNRLKTWKNWQKFGVNAFWNPYQEEVAPFRKWLFDGQLYQPYPGFGDAFPDDIFHPIHNGFDGWIWTTHGTLEVPQERLWNYYFSKERLLTLIQNRNIHITHVYPGWVEEEKGFWRFDKQNHIIAEQGFNEALARIDSLRTLGLLLPATVGELLHYHSQCQKLDYKPLANGSIQLSHQGNKPIHGLSFITKQKNISITNKTFQSRPSGNEIIFWFDMLPGETVTIKSEP